VRLGENKVSHEYETPKGKVWTIKDKFEGFNQKKKKKVVCGEKMSGERKERVRKEECVGKVGEIPYTCLFF